MRKLIIANWKMNPDSPGRALRLARFEDKKGVVIAPPFPFLGAVGAVLRRAKLGAQDAFWLPKGAHTGEVSVHQLRHLRVAYVILGHSERRALGESDVMVNQKVKATLAEGLTPILCVGEPWSVRKKGIPAAKRFVKNQLQKDLENCKLRIENLIIAYEPVWAIGTGRADKPSDTVEMVKFVKNLLTTHYSLLTPRVLYGGSVTAKNAAAFLNRPEIDGALVGGASLKPGEFKKIVELASL